MTAGRKPDANATLRARLVTLRADALDRLAECDHLDAGLLAVVGNATAALAALDQMSSAGAEQAERVVVSDDNVVVSVVLYTGPVAIGAVALDPVRCVLLAQRLLESAGRRL